jgi:hypothetical protein
MPAERERVENHLRHCGACVAHLEDAVQTRRLLEIQNTTSWTPPDMHMRIALMTHDRPRRLGLRVRAVTLVAAIAILALFVGLIGAVSIGSQAPLVASNAYQAPARTSCDSPCSDTYRAWLRSLPKNIAGSLVADVRDAGHYPGLKIDLNALDIAGSRITRNTQSATKGGVASSNASSQGYAGTLIIVPN